MTDDGLSDHSEFNLNHHAIKFHDESNVGHYLHTSNDYFYVEEQNIVD